MKYRDAKKLQNGDQVRWKEDQSIWTVKSTEVYGQHRIVKLNCVDENNSYKSLFNDEVE